MKFKEGDILVFNGTGRRYYAATDLATAICKGYKGKMVIVEWIRDGHDMGQQDGNYYEEMFTLKLAPPKRELPKSFACKNTDEVLWKKYIAWLNKTYGGILSGNAVIFPYYGVNKNGSIDHDGKSFFDVILSLEEWDEIVNGQIKTETMKKQSITRAQLKEIHDIACSGWQKKIEEFAQRNPFGDTIEFTDKEVQEMFDAATPSQLEVIKRLFKKPFKDINLHDGKVDGLEIFKRNGDSDSALIALRVGAQNKYYLNAGYNWRIEGHDLIIERK